MKIAIVTSEAAPFSKTGGLADVTGALFSEYVQMGHNTSLFVPLYRETKERLGASIEDTGIEITVPLGGDAKVCKVFRSSKDAERGAVFLIGNDEFFDRDELYGNARGDYPDNDRRFIFFCRSVLEICAGSDFAFDIIHCNDWQTGLVPLYVKTLYREAPQFRKTKSVLTIHNLGYQGHFPAQTMGMTGLGWEHFNPEGVEFYGKVNFLKAGIIGADIITTVSASYAREILTPDFGFGLEGVLRRRADSLYGVLNGVDYGEWNPLADPFLPRAYGSSDLSGKARCKRELIKRGSLKGALNSPVLCFIGRLSGQKGIELLVEIVPELISLGALFVIIGKGEEHFQSLLKSLKAQFPGRIFLTLGFDEALAHLAYAGSDIFLMPSLYEPCGLGQMIAMRYGTLPVARKTGGPADTVDGVLNLEKVLCERLFGKTTETGFLFSDYSAQPFLDQIRLALCLYDNEKPWQRMVRNAMAKDFSWKKSALRYLDLYSGKPA